MLEYLGVWTAGLILLMPVALVMIAWCRAPGFCSRHQPTHREFLTYRFALSLTTFSTFVYVCYWVWRIAHLYAIQIPMPILLWLDWTVRYSRLLLLPAISIVLLMLSRGPLRIALIIVNLWLLLQQWFHPETLHRA